MNVGVSNTSSPMWFGGYGRAETNVLPGTGLAKGEKVEEARAMYEARESINEQAGSWLCCCCASVIRVSFLS